MSEIRSQATPARDELAGIIHVHVCANNLEDCTRECHLAAAALQKAGWSKPHTVNSIEEALTLPQGTVIRPGPIVWPRSGEISVNISDQRHYVHWTGSDCPDELATWMLPFTVLFTPGEAG
ncbi:hypothetical protein [Rhodococcus sp. 66b]|uniref:hypothetical protein n=1 Tax=Rhodococcus sp. 66b TaxID=1945511 RepID=UPI0009BB5EF5|nr:hypothetical protein [Rhodococcus sp. 66b]OQM82048.1 hypothetical protein B0E55_01673 [Rhodococcus sp. 66b]